MKSLGYPVVVVTSLLFIWGGSGCSQSTETEVQALEREVRRLQSAVGALKEQAREIGEQDQDPEAKTKPQASQGEVGNRQVHLAPPVTHWEIEQPLVDELRANTEAFGRGARFVPAFEAGKMVGFKLVAIRRDSPYEKLRLVNGDIITAINGHPMTSVERANSVSQKLEKSSALKLRIKRGAQTRVFEYEAVPAPAAKK